MGLTKTEPSFHEFIHLSYPQDRKLGRRRETGAMQQITLFIVVMLFAGLPATVGAEEQKRYALLIGNQGYTQAVGPLKNPHNDVNIIAASLDKIGFRTEVLKDASYRAMDIAIKRHVERVRLAGEGAISFFYYSGHGVANPETQQNYLVPIDVTKADDANLWYESFQQNEIINRLVAIAGNATHYVVFDACRDELRLSGPTAKSLGKKKGFLAVDNSQGVLIAYATAPGQTASDVGEHSGPYAKVLAAELVRPGLESVEMFRRVQLKVKAAIGQDPWLSFPSLPEVYLAGEEGLKPKHGPPKPTSSSFAQQAELAFWNAVKDSRDAAALQTYVKQFPDGTFVPLAQLWIKQLQSTTEKQPTKSSGLAATSPPGKPALSEKPDSERNVAALADKESSGKPPAAPATPEPTKPKLRLPSGAYRITDGRTARFSCRKSGSCSASVSAGGGIGASRMYGKIDASGWFTGVWVIGLSLQRCSTKRYNSYYWGRARLKFNARRSAWKGSWGHCNGRLTGDSRASR